jgi:N-methylhydantoinase A/oxoprolinase/acetone carboxylase beta subunit
MLSAKLAALAKEATVEVAKQQIPAERIKVVKNLLIRYTGTDTAFPVAYPSDEKADVAVATMTRQFEELYLSRQGN